MNEIKVGDELAFQVGGFNQFWEIHRVEKITPSGRIKVGRWVLDPDLRVRGGGLYSPHQGHIVTQEIRDELGDREKRTRFIGKIGSPRWRELTTSQLERIAAILSEETC